MILLPTGVNGLIIVSSTSTCSARDDRINAMVAAYHPSPTNWRFPFYTLMLDRFINGDPTNDDANGTAWEHELSTYGVDDSFVDHG